MDSLHEQRVNRLRERISKDGIEVFAVVNIESSDSANLMYLTGFHCSTGLLIITGKKISFLTDGRYLEAAQEELEGIEIESIEDTPLKALVKRLKEISSNKIAFDQEHVTLGVYRQLEKKLPDKHLVGLKSPVQALRTLKDNGEINFQKEAAKITDRALENARKIASPGMTEKALAIETEAFIKKNGAEGVSFDPIVASGENTARPHAQPTDRPIGENDLVLIDIGARFNGYCSDITRTFFMGEPSKKALEIYDHVSAAQRAGLNALSPGKEGTIIDKAARDVMGKKGYEKNFEHGLGHGVGIEVHEAPTLSPSSDSVLEESMVVTIEPGIYIPEWGGIRIEDMVVVTDSGYSLLTSFPRKDLQNLHEFNP